MATQQDGVAYEIGTTPECCIARHEPRRASAVGLGTPFMQEVMQDGGRKLKQRLEIQ
jgi:hypothetical protein